MNRLVQAGICILLLIIDNSIMPFFEIGSYYPSVLLIFAILYAMINGRLEAIYIGVFSGFLQDIYFVDFFGINCIVNMAVCLIAAKLGENLFRERALIPVIGTMFVSILKYSLVYGMLYSFGIKGDYKAILFCSIYGMFIAAFIYKLVYKFSEMPFMKREWKF